MRWIEANFEAPRDIVVAGSSAGGAAAPLYANLRGGAGPDQEQPDAIPIIGQLCGRMVT